MEITIEMLDQVRERTGVTYEEAKRALEAANGSVVDAVIAIEKGEKEPPELIEKVKAAVKKGNVTKIRVSKDGRELASIPVTVGAAAGVLGLMISLPAVIAAAVAGAVAKYGFDCKFELVHEDGTVEELIPDKKDDEGPTDEE